MRKTSAILILAMFILSIVPSAFAEGNGAQVSAGEDGAVVSTGDTLIVASEDGALVSTEDTTIVATEDEASITTTEDEDSTTADDSTEDSEQTSTEDSTETTEATDAEVEKGSCYKECVATAKGTGKVVGAKQKVACLQECRPKLANAIKAEVKSDIIQRVLANKQERLKEFEALKADKDFSKFKAIGLRARAIAKFELQKARTNFLKAKADFVKAKANFADVKVKFAAAKVKAAKCEDSDTEECAAVKAEIRTQSKEFLSNAADMILNELDKIKSKVQESEDLSAEEAAEIIAKLDERIKAVEDAKVKIDALTTESTKEEVQAAAKALRDAWQGTRVHLKVAAGRIVNANIGGIVVKSKQLEVTLNKVLEKMAQDGKDTSAVDSLVTQFNEQINTAKAKYEDTVAKFEAAKAAGSETSVKEAQAVMQEAQKALQDAHSTLKEILQALKQQGADTTLAEVEAEEAAAEPAEEVSTETTETASTETTETETTEPAATETTETASTETTTEDSTTVTADASTEDTTASASVDTTTGSVDTTATTE